MGINVLPSLPARPLSAPRTAIEETLLPICNSESNTIPARICFGKIARKGVSQARSLMEKCSWTVSTHWLEAKHHARNASIMEEREYKHWLKKKADLEQFLIPRGNMLLKHSHPATVLSFPTEAWFSHEANLLKMILDSSSTMSICPTHV